MEQRKEILLINLLTITYFQLIKFKQMKYLKHLPFLFKLADLICLKGYVFFCFIFDFQNVVEMIKDGIIPLHLQVHGYVFPKITI